MIINFMCSWRQTLKATRASHRDTENKQIYLYITLFSERILRLGKSKWTNRIKPSTHTHTHSHINQSNKSQYNYEEHGRRYATEHDDPIFPPWGMWWERNEHYDSFESLCLSCINWRQLLWPSQHNYISIASIRRTSAETHEHAAVRFPQSLTDTNASHR